MAKISVVKIDENNLQKKIDVLQQAITDHLESVDCPVTHRFTKGMYIREIFMPKGTVIISKIHKTQHPFIISKGSAIVSINGEEGVLLSAPHTGITESGTRRILYIEEDCIWATFHNHRGITGSENDLTEDEKIKIVDKVERKIIQKRVLKKLLSNKTNQKQII